MNRDLKKEKIKEDICAYLREGSCKKDAAILAGISEKTFYRWMTENDSFGSRVEANILEFKHSLVKNVNKHVIKNGMVALDILARRWPKDWGKPRKMQYKEPGNYASLEDIADSLKME